MIRDMISEDVPKVMELITEINFDLTDNIHPHFSVGFIATLPGNN